MPKINLKTFHEYYYSKDPVPTGKQLADYFGVSEPTICYRKKKMYTAQLPVHISEEDPIKEEPEEEKSYPVDMPEYPVDTKPRKKVDPHKTAAEIYKQILLDHMKVIQESLKNIEEELSQPIPIDTDVRVFVDEGTPGGDKKGKVAMKGNKIVGVSTLDENVDIYTECTALIENFISGYRTSDMLKIPLQHFVDYISKRAGWDD